MANTRDGRSFKAPPGDGQPGRRGDSEILASFHRAEPTARLAAVRAAGAGPRRRRRQPALPEVGDRFEAYVVPGSPSGWPLQPFWFRAAVAGLGRSCLRACAPTFISDCRSTVAACPPGTERTRSGGAATLDHAVWFHRPIDRGWHYYDAMAPGTATPAVCRAGSIRDEHGTLVASVVRSRSA